MINLQSIRTHQITDEITKITTPTQNLFIPIGVGIIEDEDFEERIEIIFPSKYSNELERFPYFQDCYEFEKSITELLEDNMKLRSNFEFTVENGAGIANLTKSGITDLQGKGKIT